MPINIAPCGLVCSQCDAYRATQANDAEKIEQVAADWRQRYHNDDIKAEGIPCDGCMTVGGRKCFHCEHSCALRRCAVAKKVNVCSECSEYPCKQLKDFFNYVPAAQAQPMREILDSIAAVEKNMHTAF